VVPWRTKGEVTRGPVRRKGRHQKEEKGSRGGKGKRSLIKPVTRNQNRREGRPEGRKYF